MNDKHSGRTDADLEAMLHALNAEELELLQPPDDVWAAIESAAHPVEETEDTVVPMQSRWPSTRRLVLGAAAVLVLVAAGVAAFMLTRDDPGRVVASASLAYDPGNFDELGVEARAGVDLIADSGGHRIVIVDAALPSPEAGADLEMWLIRPDIEGNVADLVSLGVVDPADLGSLQVPAGYDPGAYYVVDISVEPRDGDEAHSGRSILRGPLRDA